VSINENPIDSHRLSRGICGSEIDYDITPKDQSFLNQITSLIVHILVAENIEFEICTQKLLFPEARYIVIQLILRQRRKNGY